MPASAGTGRLRGAYQPGVPTRSFLKETEMRGFALFVAWCVLFVLCWPLALLALVLWPLVWLLSLPLRLIGITFEALFALLRAVLFLPVRLLGYRGRHA
jgi:uncharacterized RDD family membrane protein YckC